MAYVKSLGTLLCLAVVMTADAPDASAQHRPRHRSTYRYVYRPYYSPFLYGSYGYAFAAGPAWYGYGYGYGHPYAYAGPAVYAARYAGRASLRVLVEPVEAEVYVDGYYAGIVDDFDGYLQRLYLPPGEHTVELHLDGYESSSKTLQVARGTTYKLRHEMQPLAAGESTPPRPEPETRTHEAPRTAEESRTVDDFGVLAVHVQPADSQLFIDGEPWTTSALWEGTLIHLPVGDHAIEIRKEGFRTFETSIEIRPGGRTDLNVRMPKGTRNERDLRRDSSKHLMTVINHGVQR